jgi:hypothetical protein
MPDSRTVLPAPKLLNLTSVRAEESAITLCAQTNFNQRSSMSNVRKAIRKSPLPVYEDAG